MPLSGIRIVDLTRILAGPFCTGMLADMGADVVKVETPGIGDPLRAQGAIKDGLSWYFAGFNRNKRSLSLNLRSEAGRAVLARLIADPQRRREVRVVNLLLSEPGTGRAQQRKNEALDRLDVHSAPGFSASIAPFGVMLYQAFQGATVSAGRTAST